MSEKRHLDIDPITGATSTFEYDESEDKAYVHQVTDVSPIIERNKQLQNDGTDGWVSKGRELRHAAHIPNAVIEMWKIKYGVDAFNKNHLPAVKRLLNSSEWAYLRTANFKL